MIDQSGTLAEGVEVTLIERCASEECGCPEEKYLIGGVETTIHMEADGKMHVSLDDGDSETEMMFHSVRDLDHGRDLALGWAKAMLFATVGWR
jgi:hypothetical protein